MTEALLFRRAGKADLAAIVTLLEDDPLRSPPGQWAPPPVEEYWPSFEVIDRDPNQLLGVACATMISSFP